MKFKININFNIDKRHSVKNGTRRALINHERRKHGYTANKAIDPRLSKYNSYNTLFSYKNAMKKTLEPYIKHHNNLKSVKKNPKRKIKNIKQLLDKRGKRIPYKYVVLKLGNGLSRKELLNLFKSRHLTRNDYSHALNQSFIEYAKWVNEHVQHIKFDHADSNLDEVRGKGKYGGDHVHLGCLGIATTKSGKTSLSFDRATKQQYDGHNGNSKMSNIGAWHFMQNKVAHHFLDIATPIFQQYLGKDFHFQLERNPDNNNGMEHDAYVRTQKMNDKLRASNQQLKKVTSSAVKHSIYSTARAKSLILENQRLKKNQRTIRYNWFIKYSQLKQKYKDLKSKVQSGISSNNQQLDWLKKPKTSLKSSIINSMKNYAKSYAKEYVKKLAKNLRNKISKNSSGKTHHTTTSQKPHSNSDNDFAKMLGYKSPKQMQNKIKSAAGVKGDNNNNKSTTAKKKKVPNPNKLDFSPRRQKPKHKITPSDSHDFN